MAAPNREQPLDYATHIHDVGDEDEHRHRDQQIAVVEAIHRLIDDESGVLVRGDEIRVAGGEHREPERRAEHRRKRKHTEQDP